MRVFYPREKEEFKTLSFLYTQVIPSLSFLIKNLLRFYMTYNTKELK